MIPLATTAMTGSPRARKTPRYTHAASAHPAGTRHLPVLLVSMEDLLHCQAEVPGEPDGQRQRRVISPLFDGVDRLPGHAERLAEGLLGQSLGGAQRPHVVQDVKSPLHSSSTY